MGDCHSVENSSIGRAALINVKQSEQDSGSNPDFPIKLLTCILKERNHMIEKLINRFFDYDIVGEYYNYDGTGHYYKKYLKKWKLRKRK